MSKQQRGKKHRTPQKRAARSSVPRPRRAAPALPGNMDLMARMLEHAKPDQIVELVLPFLWAALSDGRAPANICVDACLTLRNAYGQLGVRAEVLPVTVAIRKKNGTGTVYGSLTPSWTGTSWNGHCALVLPDSERLVDPTIEQFDEVRKVGMGPMVGKVAMSTRDDDSLVEPGAQVMLQRGDLVLTYTVAGPEALPSVVEHPEAIAHADGYWRTGVNTASLTLAALRAESVRDRAMQAPHPRLHALLQAVGDTPYESDEAQDVRFRLPDQCGREQWLRLDEIPLPPSTPAAWPR
ncbi:hypothetical protein KBY91_31970 [Streptomyces sp. RK23]|uniref:hypothetical protein n=1 Tax=unclassified Streptomyces TaxID=2593676 RepID=UPI001B373DC8|nr:MULTISPECIES: hypothetical protein [unclassified Streptomyces]MBQ0967527.1 hypothetical protein [Streptomyces sp. RK74B]MBQ1008027.1 hypothetical protein [Streptomyces sp. RK23]